MTASERIRRGFLRIGLAGLACGLLSATVALGFAAHVAWLTPTYSIYTAGQWVSFPAQLTSPNEAKEFCKAFPQERNLFDNTSPTRTPKSSTAKPNEISIEDAIRLPKKKAKELTDEEVFGKQMPDDWVRVDYANIIAKALRSTESRDFTAKFTPSDRDQCVRSVIQHVQDYRSSQAKSFFPWALFFAGLGLGWFVLVWTLGWIIRGFTG